MAIAGLAPTMAPVGQAQGVTPAQCLSWQMDHYRQQADKYREMRDMFTSSGEIGKAEMCSKMIEMVQQQFEDTARQQQMAVTMQQNGSMPNHDGAREQHAQTMQVNACMPNQGMQRGVISQAWPVPMNNVPMGMMQPIGMMQFGQPPWESFSTNMGPFGTECPAPSWEPCLGGAAGVPMPKLGDGNPIAQHMEQHLQTSWALDSSQGDFYSGSGQHLEESSWDSSFSCTQYPVARGIRGWGSRNHHRGSTRGLQPKSSERGPDDFGISTGHSSNKIAERHHSQRGPHGYQRTQRRQFPQGQQQTEQRRGTPEMAAAARPLAMRKAPWREGAAEEEKKPFPINALPKALREAMQRDAAASIAAKPGTAGYSVSENSRRGRNNRR